MFRMLRVGAVAAVAVSSLLLPGVASATPKTVTGTVGPDFSISLKLAGKNVTKLKAGVAYRFVINDRSSIHDFHLSGPGLDKVITEVSFTGTKTVVLKLKRGTYKFRCDPHSGLMHGSFKAS